MQVPCSSNPLKSPLDNASFFSIVTLSWITPLVILGSKVEIEIKPTNDLRSYHVSSQKIKYELGWQARYPVSTAVMSLVDAFNSGKIPDPEDPKYYNIKTMQKLNIS